MVKRTLVVLGVVALMLMTAGAATAQIPMPLSMPCFGGGLMPRPLFLPVDCQDCPEKTIVQKWECNIEGPCPPASPPGGACGGNMLAGDDRVGFLLSLVEAMASPFDIAISGFGGVYGCMEWSEGPCGGFPMGPIPTALAALTYLWYPTGNSFFGGLW